MSINSSSVWNALLLIAVMLLTSISITWFTDQSGAYYQKRPLVFIISVDSFRHDFLDKKRSPALYKIATEGSYCELVPQFPSYTFTNHYSLATGLLPRHHGIVSNNFYDMHLNAEFNKKGPLFITGDPGKVWWKAEPIWITANRAGLRTATLFWPGDEIWTHPYNIHIPYNKRIQNEKRIDMVFDWIDREPDLAMVTLYFSLLDDTGHKHGPESKEMGQSLHKLDQLIELVIKNFKQRDLYDNVNLIIFGDHGSVQAEKGESSNIYIDEYVPNLKREVLWMDYDVMTTIFLRPLADEEGVIKTLQDAITIHELPMTVHRTKDLPSHFHFGPSDRIGPIIIMCEPGYTLARRGAWIFGGFHGYDPELDKMRSILIAKGPNIRSIGNFKEGKGATNSLGIYNLLANLLDIFPNANNGTSYLSDLLLV